MREAQITETDFTVRLATMRSKKSFAEVTGEIERLFQRYDLDKLSDLTAAGDVETLGAYAKQVDGPTGFGMFFQLDMGATMRPAGIPIESTPMPSSAQSCRYSAGAQRHPSPRDALGVLSRTPRDAPTTSQR
jgi:hypothetical protein